MAVNYEQLTGPQKVQVNALLIHEIGQKYIERNDGAIGALISAFKPDRPYFVDSFREQVTGNAVGGDLARGFEITLGSLRDVLANDIEKVPNVDRGGRDAKLERQWSDDLPKQENLLKDLKNAISGGPDGEKEIKAILGREGATIVDDNEIVPYESPKPSGEYKGNMKDVLLKASARAASQSIHGQVNQCTNNASQSIPHKQGCGMQL